MIKSLRSQVSGYIIFVICISFIAGCANDQYSIEQQYWQAKKIAEKVFKNPLASPPNELEKAVTALTEFARKNSQNRLSIEAEFNIVRLYLTKEEYNKARAQLKKIMANNATSEPICSEAIFLLGNSYQLQDKWDQALEQYKKIIREYPVTLKGLDVPIYIAQYYRSKFQPDKMFAAFQEAIAHYNALSAQYPDKPLAFIADKLAAQCYVVIKDWQNAIITYNGIIDKYRGKVSLEDILMEVALIYKREFKNQSKAKEVLEILLKDYPKSKFTKAATALLKEIEKQ